MSDMTITVPISQGEVAVFKIAFKKSDFMAVIDAVEFATLENISSNPLWTVV